jgi:hypothetical protein
VLGERHRGEADLARALAGACPWRPAARPDLLAFLLALLPGPDPGHHARALGGATVDRRLDQAEDRALQRGGGQDLPPAPVGVGGLGSIVFTEGDLPDLLEDGRASPSEGMIWSVSST